MQVITLSDHTGDKARQARQAREAAFSDQQQAHDVALRTFSAHRQALRQHAREAWQARRLGAFTAAALHVMINACRRAPASPRMPEASDQERIWEAGNDGESRLLMRLQAQLGPAWTAFTGYKNQKGEGDLILVGPPGLLGIEIKNIAGVISCRGDVWERDKYDNYGNCKERHIPITDRGGRSPAQQINDVCGALSAFLAKRQVETTILTAVVLTHPKARMGSLVQPTVNYVGPLESLEVERLFEQCARHAPAHDTAALTRLITQDHAHHAQGSRPRRIPSST
ncbi:nuclease-related domain-containing protein [Dyella sp.]|uniref:nuclease-related domain-containing protein n=1 Tax=Dyella sp. TaxID=1869338 RepID=UPI002BC7A657|nr:nuclease-related domain-containing protein [Dyella sp.]HTC25571.1 nuclease-related domain-containing protein [Dyella sp.]